MDNSMTSSRLKVSKDKVIPVLLFVFSSLFIGLWALSAKEDAVAGLYLQAWPSEQMMQTVSIIDLSENPLETIFNIHIQPPMFDTIRALLALPWKGENIGRLQRIVDFELYILWIGCYALTGVVIYLWGSKIINILGGFIIALLFYIHPASILYATFLETTMLTALLITCFYYLLWKLNKGIGSIILLSVVTILMIYTKSIFQWPFIVVCVISLLLLNVEKRSIGKYLAIVAFAAGLLFVKQFLQFGITTTSSFTGLNCYHSLGFPLESFVPSSEKYVDQDLPSVLTRTKKANGVVNYNHIDYLEVNSDLIEECIDALISQPIGLTLASFVENLNIYLLPSSKYPGHVFIHRIPWKKAYDTIASKAILVLLVAYSMSFWAIRNKTRLRSGLGFLLPALYIFTVSILFEKLEDMRYKYYLEPVVLIFVCVQIYHSLQLIWYRYRAE
jgi:hypothetical protein